MDDTGESVRNPDQALGKFDAIEASTRLFRHPSCCGAARTASAAFCSVAHPQRTGEYACGALGLRTPQPLGLKAPRDGKVANKPGLIERWRDTVDRQRIGYRQSSVRPHESRPSATTAWPEKSEKHAEAEEEVLQRLVDLTQQRAAEEAQGKIRWLRPEYQAPEETAEQGKLETTSPDAATDQTTKRPTDKTTKLSWPKTLQAQIRAVRDQLETAPMDPDTLASQYKRKPEKSVTQVLEALTELGMVRRQGSGTYRLREG